MEKSTKQLIIRIVFWGVILAAPVVFFSMGRVMNMLLIYGNIGGVLKDPASGDTFTDVSVAGRLQINFDDGTFSLRRGKIIIGEKEFSFAAYLNKEEDILRLSILFEGTRASVEDSLKKLPPSIIQWLKGELPDSRYQVTVIYSGEYGADQT